MNKDITGGKFVGDFRNEEALLDFECDTFDEVTKLAKRGGVELDQERAAMMGILGLIVHEQIGGSIPFVRERM